MVVSFQDWTVRAKSLARDVRHPALAHLERFARRVVSEEPSERTQWVLNMLLVVIGTVMDVEPHAERVRVGAMVRRVLAECLRESRLEPAGRQ